MPYVVAPTALVIYEKLTQAERDEVAKKITDFTNKAHIEALIKRFDWTTKWENERRAARVKAGLEDDTVSLVAGNEQFRVRSTGRTAGRSFLGRVAKKGDDK